MEYGNFELKKVIDLNLLQNIQEKFAEITGLAFVTVDFKGTPITAETNFTEFCIARRKISKYRRNCYFSDAHAGLEAAIRNEPYLYRCPGGLTDFAVPIVVRGQYLGAVLSGQVRCPAIDNSEQDSARNQCDFNWDTETELTEKYLRTIIMDYDKLIASARLFYLVINQLVEKEIINIVQDELNKKTITLMEEKKVRAELEQELKLAELNMLKAQMNPHFLFNVLNSISCFALLEGAQRTQEMTHLFSQILRFNVENIDKPVYLKDEIDNIEKYLKIQKMRFADKLSYKITMPDGIENIKIPPLLIQPFVENAIDHGILPKDSPGVIFLQVLLDENDVIIRIEDDGVGISQNEMRDILDAGIKKRDSKSMGIGISNTRKRLIHTFGAQYDVCITSKRHIGTTIELRIPQGFGGKD